MKQEVGNLEEFFSQFRRLHYKKRQIILRAEDPLSSVYYLYKGYVKCYSISESGEELTLIIFKPGDMFPIRWVVRDNSNVYFCETMTAVEVSKAPRDEFIEFTKTDPQVLYDLLIKISIRLGGFLERMEYMVFGSAYQKVASILTICADRFGVKRKGEILIKVPLTHKEIANLIGLSRETASVELKKLERLGVIIKRGGQFCIRNLNKLKKEATWPKYT